MGHLLQAAIAAHGGLDRWNSYRKVSLDLSVGGALWDFKGQTGLFRDAHYEAELNAQRAILGRFGGPDQRVRFSPNKLVLETASGEPIESRDNPREAFKGHQSDTPWDRLHAAYFDGYALWTYLTQPFLYSYPGFETIEIEPWEEDGHTWRRLAVTFPDTNANHNAEQVFYYDEQFMQRRMDYSPDVTGNPPIAQYTFDAETFDGFVFPTRRLVHRHDANGVADQSVAVITVDVRSVAVEQG